MLRVAIGPNQRVTGERPRNRATSPAFESRLTPFGWNSAVEHGRDVPWSAAQAGLTRNQVNSDVAPQPQPQVVVDVGWVDQTCQNSTTTRAR